LAQIGELIIKRTKKTGDKWAGGIRMKQEIWHGDCLELMENIPDGSVDMVLCDLPYSNNICQGKNLGEIDLKILFQLYLKILSPNGNIVLFGAQPFTSELVIAGKNIFKYSLVWEKQQSGNPFLAKRQIRRNHEDILVFYKKSSSIFNPQMEEGKPYKGFNGESIEHDKAYNQMNSIHLENKGTRYPKSILKFNTERKRQHPTQKPVALCEYLIKTYTNENDLVLDNCAGSGSTLIAAKNLNRQFIGIEKEKEYYDICLERLK